MLSIPHLIIIFLVALIVFGPEKLPELARNFGRVMAEFRRATGDLRSTFEEHMRDLEREADEHRFDASRTQSAPFRVTGTVTENAPAHAVPTAPVNARLPEPAFQGDADPQNESTEPHADFSGQSAYQDSHPSSESLPDPAAGLAPAPARPDATRAEDETKSEIVSDGHSPA